MEHVLKAIAIAATLFATPAVAADRYEFDKSHTRILFFINHLGFSETVGEFTDYDGAFTFDTEKPETSTVNVTLKPTGVRTPSKALDEHLQKEEFFNSAKFPDIRFTSKNIKVTGTNTGEVTGDLTLLGVTKPVTLQVTLNKADYQPITNNFVAGFKLTATLKRSDFGMTNAIPMVGDEVRLEAYTEIVNLDRKKQEAIKH